MEPTAPEFDPNDPAVEYEVAGTMKRKSRRAEICHRLSDAGKIRYSVATHMSVDIGGHRDVTDNAHHIGRIQMLLEGVRRGLSGKNQDAAAV
jgi:hypothetical protein